MIVMMVMEGKSAVDAGLHLMWGLQAAIDPSFRKAGNWLQRDSAYLQPRGRGANRFVKAEGQ